MIIPQDNSQADSNETQLPSSPTPCGASASSNHAPGGNSLVHMMEQMALARPPSPPDETDSGEILPQTDQQPGRRRTGQELLEAVREALGNKVPAWFEELFNQDDGTDDWLLRAINKRIARDEARKKKIRDRWRTKLFIELMNGPKQKEPVEYVHHLAGMGRLSGVPPGQCGSLLEKFFPDPLHPGFKNADASWEVLIGWTESNESYILEFWDEMWWLER